MMASGEGSVRPVNAPDGWVLLLTGRSEYVEMMAGRLRHEGLRVVTRHRLTGAGSRLGGGWQKELLVPILAEPRARQILEQPAITVPTGEVGASKGWQPEVIDAGEGTLESVTDLLDAAAKLVRSPWSVRGAEDLAAAADAMTEHRPPYGFDPDLWESATQTTLRLLAMIREGAAPDSISQTALRLRALLSDQV